MSTVVSCKSIAGLSSLVLQALAASCQREGDVGAGVRSYDLLKL